jgi:hypothetical protein
MKKLIKKDGSSWTMRELRKVLKPWDLRPEEKTGKSILIKCPFNTEHPSITINADQELNEQRDKYQLVFQAYCMGCEADIQKSYPDYSHEEVLNQRYDNLLEWLKSLELVDGRWRPHLNPYDVNGQGPALSYLPDIEGDPLLYSGAIHFLYGKPGTLKSWIGLSTLGESDVKVWDFENGVYGTRERLELLGIPPERCGGYLVPQSTEEIYERVSEYQVTKPEILVIDGFSGLSELMGVNSDSNHEVMTIFNKVLFPLKLAGICVLILDHLPKDASTDDYPIGAQAKKSQSDVAILVKPVKGTERVEMYLAKDRHGHLQSRCEQGSMPRKFASVELHVSSEPYRVKISPKYRVEIQGLSHSSFDSSQMHQIWKFVKQNPHCTKGEIEGGVSGKHDRKRKNIQNLIDDGYLGTNKVGTAIQHWVTKEMEVSFAPLGREEICL